MYLGTAAHSVIILLPRSLIPSRANHQSTFMLACIRDVGNGKLRIHTYRTGAQGPPFGSLAAEQETASASTA